LSPRIRDVNAQLPFGKLVMKRESIARNGDLCLIEFQDQVRGDIICAVDTSVEELVEELPVSR
jgi:hypothetical protein